MQFVNKKLVILTSTAILAIFLFAHGGSCDPLNASGENGAGLAISFTSDNITNGTDETISTDLSPVMNETPRRKDREIPASDEDSPPQGSMLSSYDLAAMDIWTVTAPSGASIPVTSADWVDVPYNAIMPMSLFFELKETQDLKITFAAEAGTRVDIRVLVDSETANPGMAQFTRSDSNVFSFTFIKTGVSPGMHDVKVQMRNLAGTGEPVVTGYLADRSLTVLAVDSSEYTLGTAYYDGGATFHMKNDNAWSDVPSMTCMVFAKEGSSLDITFSTESWVATSSDRMFVRALVDGVAANPADVILNNGDTDCESRSFTFTRTGVSAGWHTVSVQWEMVPGTGYMKKRSLAVYACKPSEGLLVVTPASGPDISTNSFPWVNMPGMATGITTSQACFMEASVCGEVEEGPVWVRILVDGVPMSPSDVLFDEGPFTGTNKFVFTGDIGTPGTHTIQVQWSTDGTDGYMGDRTLSVIAWQAKPSDKIGVFRNGFWILDKNGNFQWDGTPGDMVAGFGMAGDVPVIADWNEDKQDNIGVFRNGFWILDYNGNFQWNDVGTGNDVVAGFGAGGDIPVPKDWNGDVDSPEIAVFRASAGQWIIDQNANFRWDGTDMGQDLIAYLGQPGDKAAAGEWDVTPGSEIGVFRDGFWILDGNGNFQWDGPPGDIVAGFGMAGDIPVIADWNSDNRDNIGVFRNGFWILDYNGNFQWDDVGTGNDVVAGFGAAGDVPVVKDWNKDGLPEIGVFRASAGQCIIDMNRNFQWDGTGTNQDVVANLGQSGDLAAAGAW